MANQGICKDISESEELVSELIQMIKSGKTDKFITLFSTVSGKSLESLANSTERRGYRLTLLILAVNTNQEPLCRFLLKNGADVNLGSTFNTTPLHFAANPRIDFKIMELLLQNGADPNVRNKKCDTALHYVCDEYQPHKAEILLKYHADVNVANYKGERPLHIVAQTLYKDINHSPFISEDADCVCVTIAKMLIKANADMNAQCNDNITALHHASVHKCTKLIGYLLDNGASVDILDMFGETPCQKVIQEEINQINSYETTVLGEDFFDSIETEIALAAFINKGSDINHANVYGETLLHKASILWPRVIDLIMNYGGDKNVKNNLGRNALHTSVIYSTNSSEERLENMKLNCKSLIKHGISVNEPDINGATALHHAVNIGSFEMTELLIDIGADVNLADRSGTVPLHIALALKGHGHEFMLLPLLLLSRGANIKAVDINGSTIAHYAAWYTGAPHTKAVKSPEYFDRSYTKNIYRDIGSTLQHDESVTGPNVVQALVSFGVGFNNEDDKGNTAITLASVIDNVSFLKSYKCALKNVSAINSDTSLEETSEREITASDVDKICRFLTNEMETGKSESELETENESDQNVQQPDNLKPIIHIPQYLEKYKAYHKNLVKHVSENPFFDRITHSEDANYLRENIHELVQVILRKITEKDQRFEAEAILSGSVSEGAKVGLPDEFDYICSLRNFDYITTVDEEDPERPPCFASLVINKKGPNPQSETQDFSAFFDGPFLEQNSVSSHFYQLLREVVHDPVIWSAFPRLLLHQEPKVEKGKIHSLSVKWRGWLIKDMVVSVDFVPAIPKRKWWPSNMRKSTLTTYEKVQSIGSLLIMKSDSSKRSQHEPVQGLAKFLRISFSETETYLLKTQNEEVRLGYKLAKYMIDHIPPWHTPEGYGGRVNTDSAGDLISSYMLKTCLFHLIENNTNCGPLVDEALPQLMKIQSWAYLIYDRLSEVMQETQGRRIHSFFIPEYNIISLEDYCSFNVRDQKRLMYIKLIRHLLESE